MKAEVNVFLKCLRCGTFITSFSIRKVAKHLEKCWSGVELEFIGDTDDFISEQTQPFTFTQPSVMLVRCGLERSNLKVASKQELGNNDDTHLVPVPTSIARKECQNKRKGASNPARLEAIKKPKLVPTPDPACVVISDLALKMGAVARDTISRNRNIPKIWFRCHLCNAKFTTKYVLTRHKNNVHFRPTGEGFTCSICFRILKNRHGRSGFQMHLLRHQKAEAYEKQLNLWKQWPTKPPRRDRGIIYNCKYCLKKLTNHSEFLSHMETDHSDDLEHSSFQCLYSCSAQLDSIAELIAHFKSSHSEEYFGPLTPSGEVIKNKRHNNKPRATIAAKNAIGLNEFYKNLSVPKHGTWC